VLLQAALERLVSYDEWLIQEVEGGLQRQIAASSSIMTK
jgi:hypothetical protein